MSPLVKREREAMCSYRTWKRVVLAGCVLGGSLGWGTVGWGQAIVGVLPRVEDPQRGTVIASSVLVESGMGSVSRIEQMYPPEVLNCAECRRRLGLPAIPGLVSDGSHGLSSSGRQVRTGAEASVVAGGASPVRQEGIVRGGSGPARGVDGRAMSGRKGGQVLPPLSPNPILHSPNAGPYMDPEFRSLTPMASAAMQRAGQRRVVVQPPSGAGVSEPYENGNGGSTGVVLSERLPEGVPVQGSELQREGLGEMLPAAKVESVDPLGLAVPVPMSEAVPAPSEAGSGRSWSTEESKAKGVTSGTSIESLPSAVRQKILSELDLPEGAQVTSLDFQAESAKSVDPIGSPIESEMKSVEQLAAPVEPVVKPIEALARPDESVAKPYEPVAKPDEPKPSLMEKAGEMKKAVELEKGEQGERGDTGARGDEAILQSVRGLELLVREQDRRWDRQFAVLEEHSVALRNVVKQLGELLQVVKERGGVGVEATRDWEKALRDREDQLKDLAQRLEAVVREREVKEGEWRTREREMFDRQVFLEKRMESLETQRDELELENQKLKQEGVGGATKGRSEGESKRVPAKPREGSGPRPKAKISEVP